MNSQLLCYWRQVWQTWHAGAWSEFPMEELRAIVSQVVKDEFDRESSRIGKPPKKVTSTVLSNVMLALQSMTLQPGTTEQPCWLSGDKPFPADEVLVAKSGWVHLPSFVEGKVGIQPHNPALFTSLALDYDITPEAQAPKVWLEFLGQLWPDDPQSIQALQEWFGYCLLPDTRQQKMLLIIGPKRSGKGTIGRVLTKVVGVRNVAGPTLNSLAASFGLSSLIGKTVAIVSDARLGRSRDNASTITERLLAISGEDALTIDRKHKSHITARLLARFLILSNELPALSDASGALASRMILLSLTNSFYGEEDTELTEKLTQELPGILHWAMDGWKSLHERGKFVEPESSRELREQLEDLGSLVGRFVSECCVLGESYKIERQELYQAFVRWNEVNGRKFIVTDSVFGRDLRAVVPVLRDEQLRESNKRVRYHVGIALDRHAQKQLRF